MDETVVEKPLCNLCNLFNLYEDAVRQLTLPFTLIYLFLWLIVLKNGEIGVRTTRREPMAVVAAHF